MNLFLCLEGNLLKVQNTNYRTNPESSQMQSLSYILSGGN